MTSKMSLPNGAWVLVADGRKALLLTNHGDNEIVDLRVARVLEAPPNPSTAAQGTDRPGKKAFGDRSSAVEQTDWHREAAQHFAVEAAAMLEHIGARTKLVLVAPPPFLAELRKHLPARAGTAILAELAKDLTHLPVSEIEKHLTG